MVRTLVLTVRKEAGGYVNIGYHPRSADSESLVRKIVTELLKYAPVTIVVERLTEEDK